MLSKRGNWRNVVLFIVGVIIGVLLSGQTFSILEQQNRKHSVSPSEFPRSNVEVRREASLPGLRVTCMVLTTESHHASQARAVKDTWGRRCHHLVFLSSKRDPSLGAINAGLPYGRKYLWGKTKAGLRYVYNRHVNETDWVLKADDDTYVIMENLRDMLSTRNSSDLVYLGYRFKQFMERGYMSGGAGYLLSAASLKLIVETGLTNATLCDTSNRGYEDLQLGRCVNNLGIPAGDTRDEYGRERFFPLPLYDFIRPFGANWQRWLWLYFTYRFRNGVECCSDTAVSFHYADANAMYIYEYLVYYLKVSPWGSLLERTNQTSP